MPLRCLGPAITAHGFRFPFRDWAAERTSLPREVAEMAPAHAVESRIKAFYARSDLHDGHRELMEQWSDFVTFKAPSGRG